MSGPKRLGRWDKLLPPQATNNEYYRGAPDAYYGELFEAISHVSGIKYHTDEFKLEQSDKVAIEEMVSSPVGVRFWQLLVKLSGARRVLEIGTYIGISAMAMARVMPAGGQVVTIEKFDHFAAIARRNFANNGLTDRIKLLEG